MRAAASGRLSMDASSTRTASDSSLLDSPCSNQSISPISISSSSTDWRFSF